MSIFDRILSGTREMFLLQFKVEQLTERVDKLADRQDGLTERVIRLETIISEAQRRAPPAPPPLLPSS